MATEAIGIGADTAVVGIGPGSPFPSAGTEGLAVEGIATLRTLQQALQQLAGSPLGLTGMATVFLQLLLHCSEDLGRDDGRHGNVQPVGGRHIIV